MNSKDVALRERQLALKVNQHEAKVKSDEEERGRDPLQRTLDAQIIDKPYEGQFVGLGQCQILINIHQTSARK